MVSPLEKLENVPLASKQKKTSQKPLPATSTYR